MTAPPPQGGGRQPGTSPQRNRLGWPPKPVTHHHGMGREGTAPYRAHCAMRASETKPARRDQRRSSASSTHARTNRACMAGSAVTGPGGGRGGSTPRPTSCRWRRPARVQQPGTPPCTPAGWGVSARPEVVAEQRPHGAAPHSKQEPQPRRSCARQPPRSGYTEAVLPPNEAPRIDVM